MQKENSFQRNVHNEIIPTPCVSLILVESLYRNTAGGKCFQFAENAPPTSTIPSKTQRTGKGDNFATEVSHAIVLTPHWSLELGFSPLDKRVGVSSKNCGTRETWCMELPGRGGRRECCYCYCKFRDLLRRNLRQRERRTWPTTITEAHEYHV